MEEGQCYLRLQKGQGRRLGKLLASQPHLPSIPGKEMEQIILEVITKHEEEEKVIRIVNMDSPRENHT